MEFLNQCGEIVCNGEDYFGLQRGEWNDVPTQNLLCDKANQPGLKISNHSVNAIRPILCDLALRQLPSSCCALTREIIQRVRIDISAQLHGFVLRSRILRSRIPSVSENTCWDSQQLRFDGMLKENIGKWRAKAHRNAVTRRILRGIPAKNGTEEGCLPTKVILTISEFMQDDWFSHLPEFQGLTVADCDDIIHGGNIQRLSKLSGVARYIQPPLFGRSAASLIQRKWRAHSAREKLRATLHRIRPATELEMNVLQYRLANGETLESLLSRPGVFNQSAGWNAFWGQVERTFTRGRTITYYSSSQIERLRTYSSRTHP